MSIFDVLKGKSIRSEAEADRKAIGTSVGDDVRAIDLDAISATEEEGFRVREDRDPQPVLDAEAQAWIAEDLAERAAASEELKALFVAPDIVVPDWGRPSFTVTHSSSFVDPPEFVAAANDPYIEAVDLPVDPPAALVYSGWL